MPRGKVMGDDTLGCSLLRRRQHRTGSLASVPKQAGASGSALKTRESSPILFSEVSQ